MKEDIKILEELVNKFKNSIKNENKENYKFFGTMLFYEDIQAIENLIARNKDLEKSYKLATEYKKEQYIPKSKVEDVLERKISICKLEQEEAISEREAHYLYWNMFQDFLKKTKKELLQEGDK